MGMLAATACNAFGQSYSLDWFTIGSGGGSITGVPFSANLTIGQPVAAANPSTGTFAFDGGFWTLFGFPTSGGAVTNTDYGVGVCTNRITGTFRFINSNPAILSLLNSPGGEGMRAYYIYADSLPAGRSSGSGWRSAATGTGGDYEVTVDTDCTNTAGLTYLVTPRVTLGTGERQYFFFNAKTSPPVVVGLAGPVVDFEDCLGVVQLNFVDAFGAPVSVTDGTIVANNYANVLYNMPNGATQQRFYVRGGEPHALAITLYRGTSIYTDRQTYYVATNVTVGCDAILNVNLVIPAAGTLGEITGTVDMLREFEWSVDSVDLYADLTGVIADYGPFGNARWATVTGNNATTSASGTFHLINLVPSTDDPASAGYAVHGQMLIRSNRMTQSFFTPALGYGGNPAVVVTPGATVNLSNLFQIDPGYVRGSLRLQGPPEIPGRPAILRGIWHCGDDDTDHDGIPDRIGHANGVYWSYVQYEGVNRRATGAQYTAAHGYGLGDFDGSFDAPSSAYLGRYELALGGLQGERSLWRHTYLGLLMKNADWTGANENDYNVSFAINRRDSAELEVVPGQPLTSDVAYGFSEVILRLHSPSGTFVSPQVSFSGTFTGTNFLGQPADYAVNYGYAYGTPWYAPSNHGSVRLLLAEGTYTLHPSVVIGAGSVGLATFDLTVGAGQRLDLGTCLRLDLTIPTHTSSNPLSLAGSVLTQCSNSIVEISYVLNGGLPVIMCNNCGVNPNFNFTLPLLVGNNTLAVTARDDQGAVSSISGVIQFDEPNAPALSISLTGTNTIFVSWPSPSTGFRLEQTSDAGSGNWTTPPETVNTNGASKFILVNPPAGQRFYRLVKP